MKTATTPTVVPSHHRTTIIKADTTTPKGVAVHVDPPWPPRQHSYTPGGPLLSTASHPDSCSSSSAVAADVRKHHAELQRQQRALPLAQTPAADIPRYVAPRPSINRTSDGLLPPTAASNQLLAKANLEVLSNPTGTPANSHKVPVQELASGPREIVSLSREEQEKLRRREIEQLNQLEEEKAQLRNVSNAKVIAAAAADARRQLGQPSYVAITAQKMTAEAQCDGAHHYAHIVADLHQRLGIAPASGKQRKQSQDGKSSKTNGEKVALTQRIVSTPASVVEDVTNKVLALQRAEMAEMVARLRRLLAQGNITSTPNEIPIIPVAGVVGSFPPTKSAANSEAANNSGGDGGVTPCPACDFIIEMTSEDSILRYLIPVLKALASERIVMPMTGRRGSVSITSSVAADSAATLDSFRLHSSRKDGSTVKQSICDGSKSGSKQQQLVEPTEPSRYAVPRCFRLEIVPFGLGRVSIHVTVHEYLAEHFYKAHAQRQDHIFSLALDPPYPEKWAEWTTAHRTRLLYRVLDNLLHGGPHPPTPSVTKDIVLFPAHVDATRDRLWNSVWSARSLRELLMVDEDAIAAYFGTEVMFYYAWMNHYACWLLGAGALGVTVSLLSSMQLVDPIMMSGAYAAPETSSTLTAVYFTIRRILQYSLDIALLPSFIFTMIIGSVLCIKTWERRCSLLTMKYHLFQQEEKDEPRRDFHGTPGHNPVTGEAQLLYPAWYRAVVLQPFAWAIVVLFMACTILIMICSLNLDGMVSSPSSRLAVPFLRKYTINGNVLDATVHPYIAMLPRIGYSVCIAVLSSVFTKLANQLTKMENYRYRGEYVRALTMKRVVFEFVNSYAKLIYIAFGRGSMPELASNLQSILYVAVLSRLMTDTVVPFFVTHRQHVTRRLLQHREKAAKDTEKGHGMKEKTDASSSSLSATSPLSVNSGAAGSSTNGGTFAAHGGDEASPLDEIDEMLDPYDVYVDFIEMIIQFGYILLFAAAYPLAPFVALLSNTIEVRSDLFKMCYVVRRPVPRLGLQENATWCGIMRVFAMAAVITNTFLLAFTSHQMARWFPGYFVTNNTATALPYGSMNGISHFEDASRSAASMASLANNDAKRAHVAIDMIPGTGRIVMFYSMAMEHVMGLVAAFLLWRIPSTPRAVRHYKERRLYERMSHS